VTDKKALILGYGRAGKRHAALAKSMGLDVYIADPDCIESVTVDGYKNHYFYPSSFDLVVICTPPDLHLAHIEDWLSVGVPAILCEKPLCGIGQLEHAKSLPPDAPVMVAYNYRYHHELAHRVAGVHSFDMYFEQQRADMPEWGLLLDHASHDLDIARMITDHELKIVSAKETIEDAGQRLTWIIKTCLGDITETVTDSDINRIARIFHPRPKENIFLESIIVDPDPMMFISMWQAFLAGDHYPDLAEAIKTQELIEQCYRLNKEHEE